MQVLVITDEDLKDPLAAAFALLVCLEGKHNEIVFRTEQTQHLINYTVGEIEKFNSDMILASAKQNKNRLDTRGVIPDRYRPKHKRRY